jgi:hypothetical protein
MRIRGIALVLLAACGSSKTPYQSFTDQTRSLFCQHQVDCGFADSSYPSICEQTADGLALDESKITFDSSSSAACLAAIKQLLADCHYSLNIENVMFVDACKSVLVGNAPAGSSCPYFIECAPGNTCQQNFSSVGTCTSKCVPQPVTGGSCISAPCAATDYCANGVCTARLDVNATCTDDSCQPGLYCVAFAGTTRCTPPSASGAPCAPGETGGSLAGLVCDASRTCVPEKQKGQECGSSDECAERLVCVGVKVGTMGTCQSPIPKGGACPGDGCLAPYQCAGGTCVSPPGLGDICSGQCLEGYCNPGTNKCERQIALGADCAPMGGLSQCQGAGMCDPVTKKCKLCQ